MVPTENGAGDRESIKGSFLRFDLDSPLTDNERLMAGQPLDVTATASNVTAGQIKLIDEDPSPVGAVPVVETDEYSRAYARWLRCQDLVTLRAFEDGWSALEELVLCPYVDARRRDNETYAGDDRDKIVSYRLRQLAAEDFVKHIKSSLQEAAAMPRPVKA